MKRSTWGVFVCLISMAAIALSGCGGGTKAVSIALSSGSASAIDDGQTLTINANVANDSKGMGVTWSLSGPGSLTGQTATSVTYKSPSAPIASHGSGPFVISAPQTATVTATSAADTTKTAAVTITVNPPPSITTTQAQVPSGTAGTAYNFTFAATGGSAPLTWSASPALPDGLSLNTSTGAVTGTPTAKGTISFTLTVKDSSMGSTGSQSSQASFTITINNPPAPTITTTQAQVTTGVAGTAYSFTFHGTGSGTLTWTATGLPADGLSLNSSTGAVAGTPTAKATIAFTLTLSDTFGQSSPATPFTITINNPPAPTITTTQGQVPTGVAGTAYSFTFQGTGSGTLTWSATPALTDGLSLNSSTGAVTGTPTAKATIAFTLTLSDTFGQSSAATPFTITINNPPAPTITTTQAQVPNGTVGTPYNFTFQGTGTGTLTWSAVPALTDGLSLNGSTGAVTGTPTAKATIAFTLTLSDTFGQSSPATAFTITINNPPAPVITTTQAQVPSAVVNVAYSFTFQATGFGTLTWSVSPALTDSLSLNTSTGAISGTPTTQATVSFNLTVTDSLGQSSAATPFSITVSSTTISFTQAPPSSVAAGSTAVNVTATVTNDPGNGGVDWSLSCGGGTCGSITAHTASGAQNSWTPPSSVPPSGSVTITAAVHDFPTVTVAATVTINPPVILVVFNPAPPSSVATSSNTNLTATVSNDPSNGGVDWAVTCGSSGACGSFNPTHTASGSATVYTAPSAVPSGNTVTIKAASHTDSTQFVTATVTITAAATACGTGSESLLSGQYAILLEGFDNGQPAGVGATFNADGAGHVATTVGAEDINSAGPLGLHLNLPIDSTKSSYSVGSDHRGCLTIVTLVGTQTFRFSLGSISGGVASNGHIIEFDNLVNTAGILRKQNTSAFSTSAITGNFAFGASGRIVGDGKFGIAGAFSASGGNITNGAADLNIAGLLDANGALTDFPATPPAFTGTYAINSNGRGTLTLNFGIASANGILYVVSTGELLTMSSGMQSSTSPLFAGKALQQSKTSFGAGDLSGAGVVYASGLGSTGGTETQLSLVTATGSGTFSITLSQNDGGVLTSGSSSSGLYTVASNGRVLISGVGKHNSVLYLVSTTEGFILDSNGRVDSGFLEKQSAGPFSNGSAKSPPPYAFGTIQPEDSHVDVNSGVANFDGVSAVNGTSDDNSTGGGGTLSAGDSFSQSYSIDSTGTGLIFTGSSCSFTGGTCDLIFIVISPTRVVLMDAKSGTSNTEPSLQIADQ